MESMESDFFKFLKMFSKKNSPGYLNDSFAFVIIQIFLNKSM